MPKSNPRWIALQVLLQLLQRGRSLDDILGSDWYGALPAEKRDLALSRELVSGLCRWHSLLQPLLMQRMQKPPRSRDLDIEIILLLGLYQILIMKTDSHAAVNETVKLALIQKKGWAKGLINGLLRQLIRDGVALESPALSQAYPPWMLKSINKDWGDQAEAVLLAGNMRAPMSLRLDTRQLDRDACIASLAAVQIEAAAHPSVDTAILLQAPCDVLQLPGFDTGLLSVQDSSAQIAATLLRCEPGMRLLDACAAPGGKSAHLLQLTDDLDLDALDLSATRLQRVEQNLGRINKQARLLVGDVASPDDWFDGQAYDRILADLPCSATGVIRRNPDIKLLRRESDIIALVAQQRQMLHVLWRLLKPGGIMLYSTCSILKDENENQVADFLKSHDDASELTIDNVGWGEARPQGRQILTGLDNMDGFYYALLHKSAT